MCKLLHSCKYIYGQWFTLYKAHPAYSDITEQKIMKQNNLIYFNESSLTVKHFKFHISIITLRNMGKKHVQFHVQNSWFWLAYTQYKTCVFGLDMEWSRTVLFQIQSKALFVPGWRVSVEEMWGEMPKLRVLLSDGSWEKTGEEKIQERIRVSRRAYGN